MFGNLNLTIFSGHFGIFDGFSDHVVSFTVQKAGLGAPTVGPGRTLKCHRNGQKTFGPEHHMAIVIGVLWHFLAFLYVLWSVFAADLDLELMLVAKKKENADQAYLII